MDSLSCLTWNMRDPNTCGDQVSTVDMSEKCKIHLTCLASIKYMY